MTLLTGIIVVCMLITAGVLITGIGSMAHGGEFDEKHAEQFMFARVVAQAVTLLLLLLALFLANS
jgi:preprotein translocase subunit SecG